MLNNRACDDFRAFRRFCRPPRALKYVSKNADKYYVKKDEIAVQGYSAGGHLASVMVTKGCFAVDDPTYVKDGIDDKELLTKLFEAIYGELPLSK